MAPIGEHPILGHIMKRCAHFGFREFVLGLGYKGETPKEFFRNGSLLTHDFTGKAGRNRELTGRAHEACRGSTQLHVEWRKSASEAMPRLRRLAR